MFLLFLLIKIKIFEHATIAVITSPAPFAKAIKVTAARASLNFKYSDIKVIPEAMYSSTIADVKLNIK